MAIDREEMKLGITVQYMVAEENEQLLDLHLDQISAHTTVPYTIYGSVNRLDPDLVQRLERDPNVRIWQVPTTDLRRKYEHSYYLKHLIGAAIDDGTTHIVTLHVDSFPVRDGWARKLAGYLEGECVLTSVPDAFTACLMFPREFYVDNQPELLLTDDELESDGYKAYDEEYGHIPHSGIGYLYKVYSTEGLIWHPLESPDGRLYDNVLYHFRNAILRDHRALTKSDGRTPISYIFNRSLRHLIRSLRPFIPDSVESTLVRHVRPLGRMRRNIRQSEMPELPAHFDAYIRRILERSEKQG